jgi:hypothetical protein
MSQPDLGARCGSLAASYISTPPMERRSANEYRNVDLHDLSLI